MAKQTSHTVASNIANDDRPKVTLLKNAIAQRARPDMLDIAVSDKARVCSDGRNNRPISAVRESLNANEAAPANSVCHVFDFALQ